MASLTSLPLHVQSHILSFLSPSVPPPRELHRNKTLEWLSFRDPPVTLSLNCAQTLTTPLPTDLLAPAKASPILAAAIRYLLGSRLSYLTACNTTGDLASWLTTFAPYVKAISARNPLDTRKTPARSLHHAHTSEMLDDMCRRSIHLFNTFSMHAHCLVVLDLIDLPFPRTGEMHDRFMAGLCATLETVSATLRELALPVFHNWNISEHALELSTLKRLQVFTIHSWTKPHASHPYRTESEPNRNPFLRMIRAVDGHADRSRNLTTLTELRLINVSHMPPASTSECGGVFAAVTTLRVSMSGFVCESDNSDFLRMFTNLQRLFLRPGPGMHCSHFDTEECRNPYSSLRELHLCPAPWFTSVEEGATNVFEPPRSLCLTTIGTALRMSNRKIRTLMLPYLAPAVLRRLIKRCPTLEFLWLNVRESSLGMLGQLIGNCEDMKALHISLEVEAEERLDAEDWRRLSRAVPDSHRNLCQIEIDVRRRRSKLFTSVECMIDCFVHIVEALGARARRLAFRVEMRPKRAVTLLEGVCRLLESCIHHATALEVLRIDLRVYGYSFRFEDRFHEMDLERKVVQLENKLLREVPSLRVLELGRSAIIESRSDA